MNISHGNSTVDLIDGVIYITLKGAFNKQGTEVWINKLKNIVEGLEGKPFSLLLNHLETEGATPEAFKVANEYNKWLDEQNLVAKAIVSSSILAAIDLSHIEEKNRESQNFKYFKILPEAIKWLETQNK